jgi:hypothetical protein
MEKKSKAHANRITLEEIEKFHAKVTATPEASRAFLMRAGIVDKDGNFTAPYRKTKGSDKEISYRWGYERQ